MTTWDELPVERHGTPVGEAHARMFKHADGSVRVAISGETVYDARNASSVEFTIGDRTALRILLAELQGTYYGWPGDYR